jgi:hypothetical protein
MATVGNANTVEEELGVGVEVWNQTQVPTADVLRAMPANWRPLMDSLGRWAMDTRRRGRAGNLFDRDKFVTPETVVGQMKLAYDAVESDDIVSNVLETTEALAFSKVDFFAEDPDEQDVYNQVAEDIDLDSRLREMWRELFAVSQFYCAIWWQTKTFKVSGKNRKKQVTIRCPKALSLLDPLKIVPVGMPLFNRERLAWVADRNEAESFGNARDDEILSRLILGPYTPTEQDKRQLQDAGFDQLDHLFELNPANVFRHTATRPQYQTFASVRMKSTFELLDQKQQLRSMDRAHLIGGTNFIVLVTQGSDQWPLKPEEFAHLNAAVRTVAQTPVLVGDHRLNVQIVTPQIDNTLKSERYDTVDVRLAQRLFQMFVRSAGGDKSDKSEGLAKVVAAGMESRRKMLRRTLEAAVLRPMFEANDNLSTEPVMQFHPKSIALDFDANLATFMLSLREAREISRHTILSQFELSEAFEALMLEREKELYDDTFQTINPNNQGQPGGPGATGPDGQPQSVPVHVVPDPTKKKAAPAKKAAPKKPNQNQQRQAGRRKGGAAPGTGQGQAPRKGASKVKLAASESEASEEEE